MAATYNKILYNEGSKITKAPAAGGNPVWSTKFSGTPVTDTHVPCGYWFKDYTPPIVTPVPDTEEALVFIAIGTIYLAKFTVTGYTILAQVTPSFSGWLFGAGWDKDNDQFFVFEDDYTNVNLHKITTDGTVISTVILCSSYYYYIAYPYHMPETDKIYFSYGDIITEGEFPDQHDNLYLYFWQFSSSGTLENSWSKLLVSLNRNTELFQCTYTPSSIIRIGESYYVAVTSSYYTYDSEYEGKYSICICSLVDGDFTEYKIIAEYEYNIGQLVSFGTSLYAEIYDSPIDPTYSGLYTSTASDPTAVSFVVDLSKDVLYAPLYAAILEDLGVYISDEGKVVEVSTGTVLYQITEISVPYTCYGLARTLVSA